MEHNTKALIGVFGCGRMGGRLFLNLVRLGFRNFLLCDSDFYEPRNKTQDGFDCGAKKTERLAAIAKGLADDIKIRCVENIDVNNAGAFVRPLRFAIDAIDLGCPIGRVALWGECSKFGIPMLNAVGSVWDAAAIITTNPADVLGNPRTFINMMLPREADTCERMKLAKSEWGSTFTGSILGAALGTHVTEQYFRGCYHNINKIVRMSYPQ